MKRKIQSPPAPPHPGLLPQVGEGRLCASVSQWLIGWRKWAVSGSDVVLGGLLGQYRWIANHLKPLKTA